jgi:hypothetical protein
MSAAETFVLSGIDAAGMPACAAQRRRAGRPAKLISWPLAFSHVAARVHFIAERAARQIACASASPIASCHCCASYAPRQSLTANPIPRAQKGPPSLPKRASGDGEGPVPTPPVLAPLGWSRLKWANPDSKKGQPFLARQRLPVHATCQAIPPLRPPADSPQPVHSSGFSSRHVTCVPKSMHCGRPTLSRS